MRTALFLVLPFTSHYHSFFGLANNLRKNGYKVVFTGTENLRTIVEDQDFAFVTISYVKDSTISNWRDFLGNFIVSKFDKKVNKEYYKEFLHSVYSVSKVCEILLPSVIYIDEHLNYYYYILKTYCTKLIIVNSKLPTKYSPGIPPLCYSIITKGDSFDKFICEILWLVNKTKRFLEGILIYIAFAGFTTDAFIKRIAMKKGILTNFKKNNSIYNNVDVLDLPTIHVVPFEIEYSWYKTQHNEYFLFYLYERKEKADKFWYSVVPIIEECNNNGKKIIYASLGTLAKSNSEDVHKFIRQLFLAVNGVNEVHLIISIRNLPDDLLVSLPRNVSIYSWVPQSKFLEQCDLMITHGGMNTICECLIAGTPMLVYPLNLLVDQAGNAARVVANRWGRQGVLRKDTASMIREVIIEILKDDSYRRRVLIARTSILKHSMILEDGINELMRKM